MKKQVKDLRDKSLITFEDQDVQKLELEKGGDDDHRRARRRASTGASRSPASYPADPAEMRALLASVRGLRADDFVSDDAARRSRQVRPHRAAAPGRGLDRQGRGAEDAAPRRVQGRRPQQEERLRQARRAADRRDAPRLRDQEPRQEPQHAPRQDRRSRSRRIKRRSSRSRARTATASRSRSATAPGTSRSPVRAPSARRPSRASSTTSPASKAPTSSPRTRRSTSASTGSATPDMTVVVSDADGKALGDADRRARARARRRPEREGVRRPPSGSGIVYSVKPFVYDRIDKKLRRFPRAAEAVAGAGRAPARRRRRRGAAVAGAASKAATTRDGEDWATRSRRSRRRLDGDGGDE